MTNTFKKLVLAALFCVLFCRVNVALGDTPDLKSGVVVNDSTLEELSATSIPYAVAMCGWNPICDDKNAVDVIGFTNFGTGNIYYSLGANMQIRSFDIAKKIDLGSWVIGSAAKLCPDINKTCSAQWQALRWGVDEVLEDAVVKRFRDFGVSLAYVYGPKGPGCLRDHPLRYGDITGDGKEDLALYLGGQYHTDFLIFSTGSDALIFSAALFIDDVLPQDDLNDYFQGTADSASSGDPQFWSDIAFNNGNHGAEMRPALRNYAKLYFGDFSGDGKPEIVVWRKLYQSRLNSDSVKGYKLISQTYIDYSLVDGMYKKQDTSESTMKAWLAAKSLTWQKGYPQASECADQTGKPIPEMVDPLLNDPDVLR